MLHADDISFKLDKGGKQGEEEMKGKTTKRMLEAIALSCVLITAVSLEGYAAEADEYTFGVIFPGTTDFFTDISKGAQEEAAASKAGIELIMEATAKFSAEDQAIILEDMIKKGVDGIAIAPSDSEVLTPYIDKAVDAGIPVICFDTDAETSKRAEFIGTDNYTAGQAMAEELSRLLGGKGKILIENGPLTQAGLQLRQDGLIDRLTEKYPEIEVADCRSSTANRTAYMDDIEAMINENPDFSALVQLDATGRAGIRIFKAYGWDKEDRLLAVFDDTLEILDGIRNGQAAFTMSQCQRDWGTQIVRKLLDLSEGRDVPEMNYSEYRISNDRNIDAYYGGPQSKP